MSPNFALIRNATWCNSPLVKKCEKLPLPPSDLSDRLNLLAAISTFHISINFNVTGNLR